MRIEIYERVNALGIGAQGLGGLTTVVDVKIRTFPCHAASKPVGLIPQCAADRHVTFTLDGSGPAQLTPPDLALWPDLTMGEQAAGRPPRRPRRADARRGRDMAGRRDAAALGPHADRPRRRASAHGHHDRGGRAAAGRFRDRAIYYVGPVDAARDEVVGPAGPTTSTRMDGFTETMLAETGLLVMIGKAERGPAAIDAIAPHGAAYLIAVGGAAYLVSKAIKSARVLAFADLGMEAIHEFVVEDMPVTVAVDASGESIHQTGPSRWRRPMITRSQRRMVEGAPLH